MRILCELRRVRRRLIVTLPPSTNIPLLRRRRYRCAPLRFRGSSESVKRTHRGRSPVVPRCLCFFPSFPWRNYVRMRDDRASETRQGERNARPITVTTRCCGSIFFHCFCSSTPAEVVYIFFLGACCVVPSVTNCCHFCNGSVNPISQASRYACCLIHCCVFIPLIPNCLVILEYANS